MEMKAPQAEPVRDVQPTPPRKASPRPPRPQPPPSKSLDSARAARRRKEAKLVVESGKLVLKQQAQQEPGTDEEQMDTQRMSELAERLADLVSFMDRELRFEVIQEADLVQIQVIDSKDGKVVRKIPSDEIVRFIENLKERMSDASEQVDLWA